MNISDYINESVSSFHTVDNSINMLEEAGFKKIDIGNIWNLKTGGYYISPFPSVLFAFTVGEYVNNMHIAMAHTDFPGLKIKSNPEMRVGNYIRLNVEPYGGLIKSTWFDRPLGLAGKVILAGEDEYRPVTELYDSIKPLFIISSLAPHMRSGKTEGDMDVQKELIPIACIDGNILDDNCLINFIANELDVDVDDILDMDMYLYNSQLASPFGMEDDLLSAPRIDNLASCYCLTEGIIDGLNECIREDGINLIALFDNEEIGSRSKQGADSFLLNNIIEKIFISMDIDVNEKFKIYDNSFLLSVDGAHAMHPNYMEKSDPTNHITLGDGVVIKTSASQRYMSDSESSAVIMQVCKRAGVSFVKQVNRSGMSGGQTLGPIASSYLPIRGVDIGIPMLAMHSANELCALQDIDSLLKLIETYFL